MLRIAIEERDHARIVGVTALSEGPEHLELDRPPHADRAFVERQQRAARPRLVERIAGAVREVVVELREIDEGRAVPDDPELAGPREEAARDGTLDRAVGPLIAEIRVGRLK